MSKSKRLLVVLDTSALLYPFQEGVDFIRGISEGLELPYEFAVTDGTINELRKLSGSNKHLLANASRKALTFAEGLKRLRAGGDIPEDERILMLAREPNVAVATADSALRRKLRKMGVTVIFVAKGKRIRIEGKAGV